jgi:mono/diheme cytochrome c family protein
VLPVRLAARWTVVVLALSFAGPSGPFGLAEARAATGAAYTVTPVEGPSWLKRLGLTHRGSSMGQMGQMGLSPSSTAASAWGRSSFPESLEKPFTLSGADLYRLDCQACHNIGGIGLPPEIHSLIDPVRATSPAVIREQMAKRGVTLDAATLKQMTSQAEAAVRERLQKGGEKMPPFRHLEGVEVEALLNYLKSLAGVPGANEKQIRMTEPAVRVGEHLVKGTCLICHDATGPGRDAIAATPGLVPSLASFLEQDPVATMVRKAREGAPAPGMIGKRGEMPVLSYLTPEELDAAYVYLIAYPPRP